MKGLIMKEFFDVEKYINDVKSLDNEKINPELPWYDRYSIHRQNIMIVLTQLVADKPPLWAVHNFLEFVSKEKNTIV